MIYLITDRCDLPDEKETLKCAICIDFKFYKNKTKQTKTNVLKQEHSPHVAGRKYILKRTHYQKRMSSMCVMELL